MFGQLADFLKGIWDYIAPLAVINPWQRGCVLRLGKFQREIGSGVHFLIPFVDRVVSASTVTTTTSLSAQSVMTADNKVVTVEAIVRWSVVDTKKFLLDIWDGTNLITDSVQGAIADAIREAPFESPGLEQEILEKSVAAVLKFGICIEAVRLTTMAPVKVLRLIGHQISQPVV